MWLMAVMFLLLLILFPSKVGRSHLRQVFHGSHTILSGSCDTDWCLGKSTWLLGRALSSGKDAEAVCERDVLVFHPFPSPA